MSLIDFAQTSSMHRPGLHLAGSGKIAVSCPLSEKDVFRTLYVDRHGEVVVSW